MCKITVFEFFLTARKKKPLYTVNKQCFAYYSIRVIILFTCYLHALTCPWDIGTLFILPFCVIIMCWLHRYELCWDITQSRKQQLGLKCIQKSSVSRKKAHSLLTSTGRFCFSSPVLLLSPQRGLSLFWQNRNSLLAEMPSWSLLTLAGLAVSVNAALSYFFSLPHVVLATVQSRQCVVGQMHGHAPKNASTALPSFWR